MKHAMSDIKEDSFLKALARGDETAFNELFVLYYPKVKSFALRLIGDDFIAEDVAQDIFMKLWIRRDELESINDLKSYLFIAARNSSIKSVRQLMRKTNIDDIARQLHGPETDTVELNELLDHVRRVIDEMPSQQRRVFKMSREDGIANRKIAEQLGISRGTVTDKNGDPLIGASVKVKGQNIATVTDIDGKYSLTVARGSVLVCTYVGFVTTEQMANGNRSVDFVLDEQNRSLNELVVIGYGSQKKQSLTGAISAISSDDIVTTKNENVQNMLTGKIPGVRVVQNTAEPGEFNNSFDIRGMGSPLIIIDGIPRENMTRIDPQDIERISVLKDASAAIYGVRAANGVVLITTKRGREGHLSLEYNGNYGLQFPSGSPESALAADAMTILNEKKMHNVNGGSLRFTDEEIASYRNGTNPSTDWYHEIMKSGVPQTQHNISLSGGNEKINFYTSLGYDNQQSFIRSGDVYYEKFNMRSNITAKPFDNLTVETSMSGIMEDNHKSNYDTHWIIRCMQRSPSYFLIYANNNPDYLFDTRVDDNPYAQSHSKYVGTRRYKTTWIQTSASVKYDIPGIERLSLKALINYDYQINNNKTYWNQFYTYSYDANTDTYNVTSHNGPNRVRRQAYFRKSWIYQLSADYRHTFAKAHNVGALFLIEGRDRQGDNFYAQRNLSMAMPHLFAGDAKDQQGNMNSGQNDVYHLTNLSYIGRLNYDYLSRYLFEFSFRYDGSSMFASGNRWGLFPAVSGGWRISEEKFWKDSRVNFIDNLKFRVSYGKLGDDTAAAYQYISGYNYPAGGSSNNLPGGYIFNGSFVNASSNKGIPNTAITWYTARVYGEMPMEDFRYGPQYLYNHFWVLRVPSGLTGEALCREISGAMTESTNADQINAFGDQYKLIRELNYFIATIDKYAGNFTENEVKTWKGEMYCLRAFAYYQMVKRYGGVPIVEDVIDPVGKDVSVVNQPRNSEEECWKHISADFDQAISLLPVSSPERGRVNKNVAYGLKARAMIYAGSIAKYNDVNFRDAKTGDRVCGMDPSLAHDFFRQAYEAAKAVSGYKLYKDEWKADDKKAQYTNYCHIFNNVTNSEVMLAREFSYPDDVHGYNAYNVPHQLRGGNGYSSETNPTLDFVEMFDGLQKDAYGHIDVYNADNTYKLYDDPMDLFKDAEPRLRANVVFPNDVMSGQNIEIWRGIYTAQDASTGKINRLISDGETRTYQSIPEVDAKIVYSSNDSQTPYTLHNGNTMNPAGRSGYFTGSGDCALSGFSVRKYISETLTDDNTLENHDDDTWIELRYAEVLITEAEAAAELASYGDNSKLNEAYECINQIRERAGANLLSDDEKNGVDNFIQVVRKERRKELAFENKIWWDLKRWRVIDKEQNNRRWRVLMPFYADHAGKWFFDARYDEGNRIYTFDTRWYYQEIPSNAISSSNNLIIQNPGY